MRLIITNKKGERFIILFDRCDLNLIYSHTWHVSSVYPQYAKTNIKIGKHKYKSTPLHRMILNVENDKYVVVDHKNRNSLDNRRVNIRISDRSGNSFNVVGNKNSTSKYKGVYWNKLELRWKVQIQFGRNKYHLGTYKNEKKAALAYDNAAIKYFGEFAYLNFKRH